jgi:PAS domain-containing protein
MPKTDISQDFINNLIENLNKIHNIPSDLDDFSKNINYENINDNERNLLDALNKKFNLIKFYYKLISKSEAEFRIISEKANDGIITIDEDYTIIFTNRAIEYIFGYQKEEIIPLPARGITQHSQNKPPN